MSIKGTAAKSASGAAMSKYDVEVEVKTSSIRSKRQKHLLQQYLETLLKLEEKLDRVIGLLKSKFPAVFKDL
jgi:hypothetical protein